MPTSMTPRPPSASARDRAAFVAGVVAVAAITLAVTTTLDQTAPSLAVVVVALGFAVADLAVVHVTARRETFSWSLSEVVLALALVWATPVDLLVGQAMGLAVVLALHRKQPGVKLAFNLAQTALGAQMAILTMDAIAGGADTMSVRGLGAVLAGVVAYGITTGLLVQGVIAVVAGPASLRRAPLSLASGVVAAVGGGCLALQAVVIVDLSPWGVLPVLGSSAVVVAAYRGYVNERRHTRQVEVLLHFVQVFNSQPTVDRSLHACLDLLRETFNAATAGLLLVGSNADGWVTATISPPADHRSASRLRRIEASVVTAIRRERAARTVATTGPDDEVTRLVSTWFGPGTGVVAPVGLAGERGLFVVHGRLGDVGRYGAADVRLLSLLADQLAVLIDNRRLHHEAMHDPLTGLANRRGFETAVAQVATSGDEAAVLYVDLDGFKRLNDTLGHAAGDEALSLVARRILGVVRESDVVARLGGDEFAVLLQHANACAAEEIADRLVATVASPLHLTNGAATLGASVGLAYSDPTDLSGEAWLERADTAMYRAKRNGKGRVELAPRPSSQHEPAVTGGGAPPTR